MKKWIGAGVAMLLAGLAVGVVARAQDGGGFGRGPDREEGFRGGMHAEGREFGRSHRMGPRLLAMLDNDRMKSALGLTDDQSARLRKIVVDTEKSTIKSRADLKVHGIELRELIRTDAPDRQAVMKKVDEISALRQEMMKQEFDALLNAKSVLTPEQQKKVRSFLERGHGKEGRGERFFRRQAPPPPDGPGRMPSRPEAPKPPEQP